MKAVITVGVSASGKSTYAKELVAQGYTEINRDWIRFNIVKPGANWSNYKFTKSNEKKVTEIQQKMIMEAWAREENIVISDTNLKPKGRERMIAKLEDIGYDVDEVAIVVTRDVAIKRDNLRENGVGENVIYMQLQDWNEYIGRRTYTPNESLPKAVIFDVDGTIAQMDGRGPFEWHRVGEDKPRQLIIEMLRGYANRGYKIIICSGRSDECIAETTKWLDQYVGSYFWDHLYMRKTGDYRKDTEIKEEIFWTKLVDSYNIVACVDDRPMMIRLWHELKIPNVIAVADPYKEF